MGRPRRDLTPSTVARTLGYPSLAAFIEKADIYVAAGLRPDPISGLYDPEAFERWRRLRNASLFPELTGATGARNAGDVFGERLRRNGHSQN